MEPKRSFWIWFSPRTGSTLLCKALEETGFCGKAGEFFFEEGKTLLQQCHATNYPELKQQVRAMGMSQNGVLGIKHSAYSHRFLSHSKELKKERNMLEAHDLDWSLWSDLFPHCTHIFLTRRNKVRQAVSWWKAIQDEQWHFKRGDSTKRDADFYHEKYVFDALLHLFKECNMREAMTESFFAHNHIKPYTIVYEDMIRDYEYTLQDLLAEIGVKDKCVIEKKPFQKTANQINEQWVQQFRTDLQKGWKRIMW